MKKILLSLATIAVALSSNGQIVNKCMSHEAILWQEAQTPGFAEQVNTIFENAKAYSANNLEKANTIYTIPVVVHVVHNIAAQNIADSVVFNQIAILNENYQRLNADSSNLRPIFNPIAGNPQIEFVLAQVDPNGQPTTGITRTYTDTTSFGSLGLFTGDFSTLEQVKSTSLGGEDPWDQTRYLNIWVCNMSINFFGTETTALLGYATPPAGLPNWPASGSPVLSDGVVIQYQAFGSNNPTPLSDGGGGFIDVYGKTTVHEVGHYLGLRHIWGDGDCTAQDGIADTPNADAQSNQDCDTTKNTCVDAILGLDLPDMVENFMDYSAETCQNTFTAGQAALMHGVLDVERFDLTHNNPAGILDLSIIEWNVYPNPVTEKLTIEFNSTSAFIQIMNLSGQEIITSKVTSGQTIDVNQLEAGMYILRIKDASSKQDTKTIIVQ